MVIMVFVHFWGGCSLSTSQPHSDRLVGMYSLALYLLVLLCQLYLAIALGPHSGLLDISPNPYPLVPSFMDWYQGVLGRTSGDWWNLGLVASQ